MRRRARFTGRGASPNCSNAGGCQNRCPAFRSYRAIWTSVPAENIGWNSPPAVQTPWSSTASISRVVPNERIVWTNDEGEEGAIATVTFEDQGGRTLLNFHEVYPSKEALEEALQGSAAGLPEQLEQLDELLSSIGE